VALVDPSVLLEVSGLTKTYRGEGGISQVSLTVRAGEICGLLGPNGAGKSTTLHCITGIVEPTAGSVFIGTHPHESEYAKDQFGFVPDDLPLPESLRFDEILAMYRRLRRQFDDELAYNLTKMVGLAEHRRKYVGQYSHGMKKKLQLIVALAHHPRLMIMDEPMRGLDPEAGILLRGILDVFIAQGGGALISTHDLLGAESYCHQVVVINNGQVVGQGKLPELLVSSGAASLEQYFIRTADLEKRIEATRASIDSIQFVGARDGAIDALHSGRGGK
jgi:ABC-2 type transport system ATP-binding protein